MLESQILSAPHPTPETPILVLMHGRGADPGDLAPLRRWIPDATTLVLPRAPFEAGRWGYGPGWAWYRYIAEDRPEPDSFRESQSALAAFLAEGLATQLGHEPGPIVLGGFSQGGTMSLGYGIRTAGEVHGVVNLSGFLPDHPDVTVSADTVAGTPIFWGHGTADPAIPHALAERGRKRLRAVGADLEARDYAMGHGILPEEVRDLVVWIDRVVPVRSDGDGQPSSRPDATA